jgi:hypothetical protein
VSEIILFHLITKVSTSIAENMKYAASGSNNPSIDDGVDMKSAINTHPNMQTNANVLYKNAISNLHKIYGIAVGGVGGVADIARYKNTMPTKADSTPMPSQSLSPTGKVNAVTKKNNIQSMHSTI